MATKPEYKATYLSDDYEIGTTPKGKKNTVQGAMMSDTPNAGRGKQGGPTAGELKAKEVDDIRDAIEKDRAEKKGVSVQQMRKNMSDEFDKRVQAGELYKKGGSVKGWGKARGARKAKMY